MLKSEDKQAPIGSGTSPETEKMLRRLYEQNTLGMAICNDRFRFVSVNPAFCEMLGYTEAELSRLTFKDFTHPDFLARDTESMNKMARGEIQSYKAEKRYITRSGAVIDGAVTITTLRDESGKKTDSLVILENITQRKRLEEALRLRESYLSAIIENQPGLLWLKDSDGRFLAVNTRFSDSSGQPCAEAVVGKTDFDIWPPELAERYVADDRKVMASGKPCIIEEPISDRGTVLWFETFKAPIFDGRGTVIGTTGNSRDITERKRAETALLNTQKLESLGILAGGIAHDFNNLLTGIYGYMDLAQSISRDPQLTEYFARMFSTMNRAKALTMQLLTFAKGGAPVQKITSLVPFVQETAKFALSGSNVSCSYQFAENLWSCNIDKNQIGQVIDNIVINAKQAMPGGGTIEISAVNIRYGENEHPPLAGGDYVQLAIRDSGIGIPKEIMPRIFDPFYTTKMAGHGLGLATSHSIVRRHGGCIDVESEPGRGSVFRVYLPATSATVIRESAAGNVHRGSGTIIVMDDEAVVRETFRIMLGQLGYAVVCKNDGREVLDFIRNGPASDGLVAMVFDLTVPGGMGGIEAVRELRKIDAEIPVFVASGYADTAVMNDPAAYGFTASIPKPFTIAELAGLLEKHVANPERGGHGTS